MDPFDQKSAILSTLLKLGFVYCAVHRVLSIVFIPFDRGPTPEVGQIHKERRITKF